MVVSKCKENKYASIAAHHAKDTTKLACSGVTFFAFFAKQEIIGF